MMTLRRMLPVFVLLGAPLTVVAEEQPQPTRNSDATDTKKVEGESKNAADTTSRAALEKEFSRRLTGAALVGSFTTDGQKSEKPPSADRYELEKVSKLYGDHWMFVAKMKYGENEVNVPLTLQVLWAGDTPIITLTDFTIPGLGTFTSRVMFHGNRYAGTWQHGKSGGHMWGHVEPAKKPDAPAKKDDAPADKQESKK